ncbi:hypothetical protein Ddc_10097 [Ditylenchus destructor]|nr:hypothetical protein Ddc_10097 [Ditylenchus destructor]
MIANNDSAPVTSALYFQKQTVGFNSGVQFFDQPILSKAFSPALYYSLLSPKFFGSPLLASRSLILHSPYCKSATEPASQPKHVPLNDRNPADNRTWRPGDQRYSRTNSEEMRIKPHTSQPRHLPGAEVSPESISRLCPVPFLQADPFDCRQTPPKVTLKGQQSHAPQIVTY